MKPKHTPGPWFHVDGGGNASTVQTKQGTVIVSDWASDFDEKRCAANLTLIAAAPDMLEALEEITKRVEESLACSKFDDDLVSQAKQALAKARGES